MIRTYTRTGAEDQQTITVHVDPNGRVKLTESDLHAILSRLGFTETTVKEPTQ